MLTKYVGSGGLGDSVVIGTKLLKILSNAHWAKDTILYKHFESSKRKGYESALNQYWKLVKNAAERFVATFKFEIEFYPHGKFWETVPRAVFNTATGLTTKVDMLCAHPLQEIVVQNPGFSNSIALVVDGGGGSRGFTDNAAKQIVDALPDNTIVALGAERRADIPARYTNLTGQTTLEEALKIVRSSKIAIGPDGILTYFAAIYGIPSYIVYHEAPLMSAYCVQNLPQSNVYNFVHGGHVNDVTALIETLKKNIQ
jgi:ADP-heptose:LPS heptosyltransferase